MSSIPVAASSLPVEDLEFRAPRVPRTIAPAVRNAQSVPSALCANQAMKNFNAHRFR